jgi:hypothetical protein
MDSQNRSSASFSKHRIIDQPALVIDQRHIEAISNLRLRDVARGHPLHQPCGIRAADLHLPLAGHVPDLHVLSQVPVIFLDARLERLGQQHVVDHGKAANPGGFDAIRIGGAPDAARHVQTVGHGIGLVDQRDHQWALLLGDRMTGR